MGQAQCYPVALIDDINFSDKIRFGWILKDFPAGDFEFYVSFEKTIGEKNWCLNTLL
jgi:hypothetical protein